MMGFGHTFYEAYQWEGGQIINSSLVDYKVPTFEDVPDEFESILIEDGNGPGPYGAKGLGEGGIIPVAPAVANAVFWCTGARVKTLPLTPEKVWRAIRGRLQRKGDGMIGSRGRMSKLLFSRRFVPGRFSAAIGRRDG